MKTVKTTKEHYEKYKSLCEQKGDYDYLERAILSRIPKNEIINALETGEGHLNEIPMKKWDGLAGIAGWTRKDGDKLYKSLAEQVCLLKHIAIYRIAGYTPEFEL